MNASAHRDMPDARVDQCLDFSLQIAALRQAGAHQLDPVHLHYIEQLARRASSHQGRVKHILDGKLAQALAVFGERLTQAQSDAKDAIASPPPGAARASLGDLARYLAQHSPDPVDGGLDGNVGLRTELKTTRDFRNTWSKLSVGKRVTQALEQAPKNAGPINSHLLVLRSLALMRNISPDYLNRFTSYVDTLLCLDQSGKGKPVNAKKAAAGDPGKPVKARRSRAR